MDLRNLLEKIDQFAGEKVGQKPGDQVRGTEKTKPAKGRPYAKHPFKGRLVGGGASESILPELAKTAVDTKLVRDLENRWEQFKEEIMGVSEKRPAREGSRHPRGHEPQQGYQIIQDAEDSSPPSAKDPITVKVAKKIDPNLDPESDEWIDQCYSLFLQELGKFHSLAQGQSLAEYMRGIKWQYNQLNEYGADNTPKLADPEAAKKAMLATNQLKQATGSTAPAQNLMKALDAASQGKPADAQTMKALEPTMDLIQKTASNPQLANQFKLLAQQAKNIK